MEKIEYTDSALGKTYHFYCVAGKTELGTSFTLRMKQLKSPVNMQRLDDNIFYASVFLSTSDLKEMSELRYVYVKKGLQENLETSDEVEQERTKGKKYLRLSTFFD